METRRVCLAAVTNIHTLTLDYEDPKRERAGNQHRQNQHRKQTTRAIQVGDRSTQPFFSAKNLCIIELRNASSSLVREYSSTKTFLIKFQTMASIIRYLLWSLLPAPNFMRLVSLEGNNLNFICRKVPLSANCQCLKLPIKLIFTPSQIWNKLRPETL